MEGLEAVTTALLIVVVAPAPNPVPFAVKYAQAATAIPRISNELDATVSFLWRALTWSPSLCTKG